ncbi:hypothetical protein [Tsukamurella paurometabola]|uniref:Uncharacterized protein n=1 Tax=Tsukamurella paurometabola TaxID=2061 RepID=A0ABS5NDP5_TSUPA|nr:hypothetical protein [Tsukamurella paurometabola]MBS4102416.1 hypothetical protein [Tsukamurella paurometabola]
MKIIVFTKGECGVLSHEFAANKKSTLQVDDEAGHLYIRGLKQNAVFAKGEWVCATRDLR